MSKTLKTIKNIFLESLILGIVIKIAFPAISDSKIPILVAILILFYEWKPKSHLELDK